MIGVAVRNLRCCRYRIHDCSERRLGVLVRCELDGVGDAVFLLGLGGALAGSVRRETLDGGACYGNHDTNVVRSRAGEPILKYR